MKHLYVIGNGFDLFTGLKTSYSHFKEWLFQNYIFEFENLKTAYDMEGEWWYNFEENLGKLDIYGYVRKFSPPEKPIEAVIENIAQRKEKKKDNLPTNFYVETPCADRLRGLLDILQYCFENWVKDCQRCITNPKYIHIEKDNSFFINFNYTDVLEWLYQIPEERVLHIHGRASNHDKLIFGHNSHPFEGMLDGPDVDKTCFELCRYEKNPYQYIFKHYNLIGILKNIEIVHIYGFSISEVDEDYLDWIFWNTSSSCLWEFSWFNEKDKERINKFILNHWGIKDRVRLIRLEELEIKNE